VSGGPRFAARRRSYTHGSDVRLHAPLIQGESFRHLHIRGGAPLLQVAAPD